jgi:hypothetical protein
VLGLVDLEDGIERLEVVKGPRDLKVLGIGGVHRGQEGLEQEDEAAQTEDEEESTGDAGHEERAILLPLGVAARLPW